MQFGVSGRCALLVLILSVLQFHIVIAVVPKFYQNGEWGKTINYKFDKNDTGKAKRLSRKVFDYLSSVTCFKFVKVSKIIEGNTIVISMKESGNFAYVGRQEPYNLVNLDKNGNFKYRNVAHEILHALGLHHEHQRHDRDHYVDINETAIKPGRSRLFVKFSQEEYNTFEVPYDYSSIMHYFQDIIAVNPSHQRSMGQGIEPTFWDVQKLNRRYCLKKKDWKSKNCQNEGYLNPANNETCLCPKTFSGKHCESLNTDDGCGGKVNLDYGTNKATLKSNFIGQVKCTWNVTAPKGEKIFVSTNGSELFGFRGTACIENWIEVKFAGPFKDGQKFCNIPSDNLTIVVQNNQVYILYWSNGAYLTSATIHVQIYDNHIVTTIFRRISPFVIGIVAGCSLVGGLAYKFYQNVIRGLHSEPKSTQSVEI